MKYQVAQISLVGHRKINQDRCIILESGSSVLLVLADGLGGHAHGDIAAQCLVDSARMLFKKVDLMVGGAEFFLQRILEEAHDRILTFGLSQDPPEAPRTTAVLVLVQDGEVTWMHLGDSRLYMFRDGEVLSKTRDHSYVERLLQKGKISERDKHRHPKRNYITRCLGGKGACPKGESQRERLFLRYGDLLLACSDGFWGHLPERKIIEALADYSGNLSAGIQMLAQQAVEQAAPYSDNVTAVALRWQESQAAKLAEKPSAEDQAGSLDDEVAALRAALQRAQRSLTED